MRIGSLVYLVAVVLLIALSILSFWWMIGERQKLSELPVRPTDLTLALERLDGSLRAAGDELEALADYLEHEHATPPQEAD